MDLQKRTELTRLVNDAKALHAELEQRIQRGEAVDPTELDKLNRMIEAGKQARLLIERADELAGLDAFTNAPDERPVAAKSGPSSWGEQVITSDEFKKADRTAGVMSPVELKAIYGSDLTRGGAFIAPLRDLDAVPLGQRPPSILNVIDIQRTNSNVVEFVRMTSRTIGAAPVAEWDSAANNFGLKPQSDLAMELVTAPVRTIATWIPASRAVLEDAPQLRSIIDGELQYMLRKTLEDQIINGDGTGQNLLGILNTPGIQTRQHQTSGRDFQATDNRADTLRRAITDIYLAFYTPNAIMLNPANAEELELEKDQQGRYLRVYDAATMQLWRVPVIETAVLPQGTALVGAFNIAAKLWDRERATVAVGQPNDYFLRNAVAVLGELRAAFGVKRPDAIERVTGL